MAIGWVIVGGVSLSTILTLYAVPALYVLLAGYTKPIGAIAARLSELEKREPAPHPAPAE
jgi:multidrug efflux pump